MKNRTLFIIMTVLFGILLTSTSCTKSQKSSDKEKDKISWFKQGMDKALAIAGKENKPLFVYWGAVWCPPCNVVKSTVFTQNNFIEATKSFVSVYLDGDTESAQKWGDTLKASGYPTLMVLNPKGKEVLRLSTDMNANEMAETLQRVKNHLNPVDEVLKELAALEDHSKVNPEKYALVANYSWGQDTDYKDKGKELSKNFFTLESKVSESQQEIKDRLFLLGLSYELGEMKEKANLSDQRKAQVLPRVTAILSNPDRTKAQLRSLSVLARNFAEKTFKKDSDGQKNFIALVKQNFNEIRKNNKLNFDEISYTLYPLIDFPKIQGKDTKPDTQDAELIKTTYMGLLKSTKDPKARVSVVSDAGYFLLKAGLEEEAKKVSESEIKTSLNPYYIMSSLAYIEKSIGNKEASVQWAAKAYENAKGPATQLQWGAKYARSLIELTPDRVEEIWGSVNKIYSENIEMNDSFLGRNKRVLNKLSKSLDKWAKDKKQTAKLKKIRTEFEKSCEKKERPDFYKESCKQYFQKGSV